MKKKILLIDDDREITDSVRLALEANGYDVLVGHDGNQGLQIANKDKPDLIVLDIMMPNRGGFLVLESIRQTQTNLFQVPVIVATANNGERHKVYAEKLGVDAYLFKPFPIDILLKHIEQILTSV